MDIILPKLTNYQQEVWDWLGDCRGSGKIAVIKSVRQSGKSFFCQMLLIGVSFLHKGVSAIFEPTLNQSRNQFKQICSFFEGSNLIKNANASLLEIEFINGSQILFKSTDQSNRGFTITNVLILDECAYLKQDEIYTILPMVNAHNAPIIIASTPFTSDGYYYEMYKQGLLGNDLVKTFDWSKEKEVERFLTAERKEFYRQTMSALKFQTECLGEFIDDGSFVFGNIKDCVKGYSTKPPMYCGIDWGTGVNDYTCVMMMDADGDITSINAFNDLEPSKQIDLIANLINTTPSLQKIQVEINSIGAVYYDYLNKAVNKQITKFNTTNESKRKIIEQLVTAFNNSKIGIPNDGELIKELQHYAMEKTAKGYTYNGIGAHDDYVMALAMCYDLIGAKNGNYNIVFKKKINKELSKSEIYG